MNDLCKMVALAILLALLGCCGGTPATDPTAERPASAPTTTPTKMISSPSPVATNPTATGEVSPADRPSLGPSSSPPAASSGNTPEPPGQVRITIVYDNSAMREGLEAEWGFAAWAEYGDHTILFDTGPDGRALLGNLAELGLEPEQIDVVVLSHIHADHTGGLNALLATGIQPVVYVPDAFPESFKTSVRARTKLVEVRDAIEILPGLHSTGQLGGNPVEQALVVETSDGAVIVTGCAHPGIVRILDRAQDLVEGEIALVMGGFHLANASSMTVEGIIDTFREYGVKQVSATHCTGEEAIQMFAEEYGEDHLEGGAGRVFLVGEDALGYGVDGLLNELGESQSSTLARCHLPKRELSFTMAWRGG